MVGSQGADGGAEVGEVPAEVRQTPVEHILAPEGPGGLVDGHPVIGALGAEDVEELLLEALHSEPGGEDEQVRHHLAHDLVDGVAVKVVDEVE